jgi:hypothetical protein
MVAKFSVVSNCVLFLQFLPRVVLRVLELGAHWQTRGSGIHVGTSLQMEPIGILLPKAGMGDAATCLGMHLAG